MAHISSLWDLHITQAFDAPSSNLELCDFNLRRLGQRSFSLTLQRDALNIIGVNILNWYGAVIVLGVRQSGENIPIGYYQNICVIVKRSLLKK